jgi:hypothetical protein
MIINSVNGFSCGDAAIKLDNLLREHKLPGVRGAPNADRKRLIYQLMRDESRKSVTNFAE